MQIEDLIQTVATQCGIGTESTPRQTPGEETWIPAAKPSRPSERILSSLPSSLPKLQEIIGRFTTALVERMERMRNELAGNAGMTWRLRRTGSREPVGRWDLIALRIRPGAWNRPPGREIRRSPKPACATSTASSNALLALNSRLSESPGRSNDRSIARPPLFAQPTDSLFRPEASGFRDVHQARIMIVDDEPLNIAVVQGYLEMDGYANIASTDHAPQALPQIGIHRPDVVLLDIQMPHVDGLEILRAIRSDATLSHIPVVILTASSDDDTRSRAARGRDRPSVQTGPSRRASGPAEQRLQVKAWQDHLRGYSEALEEAVRKRTAELEASRLDVIHCLAGPRNSRRRHGQHIVRVGRYSRIIGEQLGMSQAMLNILEPAASCMMWARSGSRTTSC